VGPGSASWLTLRGNVNDRKVAGFQIKMKISCLSGPGSCVRSRSLLQIPDWTVTIIFAP
jgi:hypothetical protein